MTAGPAVGAIAHSPRILVADDDPGMRQFLRMTLTAAGYPADDAATGTDTLRLARMRRYRLVLLDLVMPDLDGRLVLARMLRDRPSQAVMILSGLADVSTKVACLELGAHDYLTKPFSLAELLARIRVQTRGDSGQDPGILRAGDLTLYLGRLEADTGQGPVALTRLEFLLLRELMTHAGESVGKDELLASIWGYDFHPGSNVVDVCVRRLRSKLGFDLIKTVRRAGYQLAS